MKIKYDYLFSIQIFNKEYGKEFNMNLQEMERKIQALQDVEEIRNLQYRYVNLLSERQWDEIANCFAEDAVCHLTDRVQGKENIRLYFNTAVNSGHRAGRQANCCVHPVITLDGDKAKGTWSLFIQHSDAEVEHGLHWWQGPYQNEYVKVNGEWKISLLKWYPRIGC